MNQYNYSQLDTSFYSYTSIQEIKKLDIIFHNDALSALLQVKGSSVSTAQWLHGLLKLDTPSQQFLAMAYAGHQFGHFTMLGDGRACLLDEIEDKHGQLVDLQLKGCGQTPYSRSGDGKAVLGPMAREYLISEAMHGLGIPTTRAVALMTTGNKVYRGTEQEGAMLLRCANSHLRVGTFEYARAFENGTSLKGLFEYAAKRHYPMTLKATNPPLEFLKVVLEKQLRLVCHWQRVGFIHGVMNTDNTTISGETIDYGPCAFMDEFHPSTVFSSIDMQKRYAFSNQAPIIFWNLSRLAETLLPLINEKEEIALEQAQNILEQGEVKYHEMYWNMMAQKIGFLKGNDDIKSSIKILLEVMQLNKLDYTNTYLTLANKLSEPSIQLPKELTMWGDDWQEKLAEYGMQENALSLMQTNNPQVIPRNHLVAKALTELSNHNDQLFIQLLERYKKPYQKTASDDFFQAPPTAHEKVYETYCGT